jgi:predicted kinase
VRQNNFTLGLPGSGKSTLAAQLLRENAATGNGGLILSTDDFFIDADGVYRFDRTKLQDAHAWNEARARQAMSEGRSPVIIDNTHVERWTAKPYVEMGLAHEYTITVHEPETPWWQERRLQEMAERNRHGVMLDTIASMADRFESNFTIEAILASERPSYMDRFVSRPSAREVCRFYEREGHCRHGSACRFVHQRADGFNRTQHRTEICRFYSSGRCLHGSSCRFRHE